MAHGQSRHEVLRIVRTSNLAMIDIKQRSRPIGQPANEESAIQMNIGVAVGGAEGDRLARNRQIQLAQTRQRFTLNNGPVEGLLIAKNARARANVIRGGCVAVE